jgi:hypothetical protein
MKLVKTANNKPMVKVSRLEWYGIGKTAGWTTAAMDQDFAQQLQDLFDSANSEEVKKLIINLQRDKKDLMNQIKVIDEKVRMLEHGIRPPNFNELEKGRMPF